MGKSKRVPKYDGPDAEILDKAYCDIEKVVNEFTDSLVDGVQVTDYIKWYWLARKSYDIAKDLFPDELEKAKAKNLIKADVPDELEKEKVKTIAKDKVINIARYIYWYIDPNWSPWIPEFIEKRLEKKFICERLIPMIIDNAWDAVAGYVTARKAEAEKKDDDERSWCKVCSLRDYCFCPSFLRDICPLRIL